MELEEIDSYLQKFKDKKRTKKKVKEIFKKLNIFKTKFIQQNNQDLVKNVWIFEKILLIQDSYLKAFDLIQYTYIYGQWIKMSVEMGRKFLYEAFYHRAFHYLGPNLEMHRKRRDKLYEKAWGLLADCEKNLEYLEQHIKFEDDHKDIYFLNLISQQVEKLQILFPFKFFNSIGMTISEKTCNICGKIAESPRSDCKHIAGEIYNGIMCVKSPSKYKELHHIAILPNPRDKHCIIYAREGYHYSYKYLDYLISTYLYY